MAMSGKRDHKEIKVQAASGGRKLTLDPIRELTLTLPAKEVESTITCGFQMEWVSGADDKEREFDLTTGGGVGSMYGTFQYQDKRYCFKAEDLIRAFIEAIEADDAKKAK
jgi:hypothetical protein